MRTLVRITKDINRELTEGMEKNLRPDIARELILQGKAEKIQDLKDAVQPNEAHKVPAKNPETTEHDLTAEQAELCDECDGLGCEKCDDELSASAIDFESMSYNDLVQMLPEDEDGKKIYPGEGRKKADIIKALKSST